MWTRTWSCPRRPRRRRGTRPSTGWPSWWWWSRTEASSWRRSTWCWPVTSSKRSRGNVRLSLGHTQSFGIILLVQFFGLLANYCHAMRITPPPNSSTLHWVHLMLTTGLTIRQPAIFGLKKLPLSLCVYFVDLGTSNLQSYSSWTRQPGQDESHHEWFD